MHLYSCTLALASLMIQDKIYVALCFFNDLLVYMCDVSGFVGEKGRS